MFPPGPIIVLLLAPTPTFFLYKKPGKFDDPPYQNCPFGLLPEPKPLNRDDIYI
jgi:hypothetical protein